jgi:hypothetical protein
MKLISWQEDLYLFFNESSKDIEGTSTCTFLTTQVHALWAQLLACTAQVQDLEC